MQIVWDTFGQVSQLKHRINHLRCQSDLKAETHRSAVKAVRGAGNSEELNTQVAQWDTRE